MAFVRIIILQESVVTLMQLRITNGYFTKESIMKVM